MPGCASLLSPTNNQIYFLMQICRVEDINVEGLIEGSVVHFHWVRTVLVKSSGAISASGLGILYSSSLLTKFIAITQ